MRVLSESQENVVFEVKKTVSPKPVGYVVQEAFLFSDLPKDVQERVHQEAIPNMEYFWADENLNAVNSFLDGFSCEIKDYSYDEYSYSHEYRAKNEEYYNELVEDFKTNPIAVIIQAFPKRYFKSPQKYTVDVNTDAITSGYCMEYNCLDRIDEIVGMFNTLTRSDFYKAMSELTLEDVINECLDKAYSAMKKDVEYHYSFEKFKEEQQEMDICYSWSGTYFGEASSLLQSLGESEIKTNTNMQMIDSNLNCD